MELMGFFFRGEPAKWCLLFSPPHTCTCTHPGFLLLFLPPLLLPPSQIRPEAPISTQLPRAQAASPRVQTPHTSCVCSPLSLLCLWRLFTPAPGQKQWLSLEGRAWRAVPTDHCHLTSTTPRCVSTPNRYSDTHCLFIAPMGPQHRVTHQRERINP